jgi:hypothetical protein
MRTFAEKKRLKYTIIKNKEKGGANQLLSIVTASTDMKFATEN